MNLAALQQQIRSYELKYERIPHSVTLLAVSKQQSLSRMADVYKQGQRHFGENYLQEALLKMQSFDHAEIVWHFIGHIQRNKTKKIAEHFAWVQSVASLTIAQRLSDQRPAHLPPLNICLEVNISNEANKSGVLPEAVAELAQACLKLPRLRLRGLMAIPEAENSTPYFKKMALLMQQLNQSGFQLDTLSIGMSNDFEAAIAAGSTMVRIGTALFGNRSKT